DDSATIDAAKSEVLDDKDIAIFDIDGDKGNIVPIHDAQTPSLDNISQHLEATKEAPAINSEALASAAVLIEYTQKESEHAQIVRVVESQEEKVHVKNPNAPTTEHGDGGGDHDKAASTEPEVAYDTHQSQQSHLHNHDDDGTGLT
ncbi:MAG: hypothetical protein KAG53_04910, partial [Endozoicomonadaceae bacterium]|nr:hypothetical protein [Endozoicomonadaceae bacterium]